MHGEGDQGVKPGGTRKDSLLNKLNVPIEHVDYAYVEKCNDGKELEKILRVLRSGEEGYYPDLDATVSARLEKVNPKSRYLRVETPILRPDCLEKDERVELETDLSGWISEIGGKHTEAEIFDSSNDLCSVPIRGLGTVTKIDSTKPVKKPNPDRIKSWEYDKWDKFDVDTELMRLDIGDMKCEEDERIERARKEAPSTKEKNLNSKASSATGKNSASKPQKPCCSKTLPKETLQESWFDPKLKVQQDGSSYIEDVTEEHVIPVPKPKRRVKIIIDDVHLG